MIYKPSLGEILSVNYRQHPRYQGCNGHWMMIEGGGSAAYNMAGPQSAAFNSTGVTWESGRSGHAVAFGGAAADYLNAGSTIPLQSASWTMTCWLKLGSTDGFQRLFTYYPDGPTIWKTTGGGALSIVHSGTIDFAMSMTLVIGEWMHVAVARNGSTITAYSNGIQTAQSTSFSVTYTKSGSLLIGNSGYTSEPYIGSIDDARIYNRALTPGEILSLYQDPFLEFEEEEDDKTYFIAAAGGSSITPSSGGATVTGNASRMDFGVIVPTQVDP